MLPGPMSDPNAEKAYPSWLESTERLRDGTEVHLRPVRSEDEPLLQDLAAHMTPEDCACDFSRRCAGSATPSPRASAISITIAR